MTIKDFVTEKWNDLKAWRRGETRVAPSGTRGRVYARGKAELEMKVTRADGSVEHIKVPATVERR